MVRPILAAAALLQLASADAACHTDEHCSLLGVCNAGSCHCDEGWTGEDCGQADLAPYENTGYINKSAASWGGRAVFAEGKWHLIATQISHSCPLILFMNNSMVVRLESTSPSGPYAFAQEVLPAFHHNPTIIGPTSDGYLLIYSIGSDTSENTQIRCEDGVPDRCKSRKNNFCRGSHWPTSNGHINMAYSRSIQGPWHSRVILPYDPDGQEAAWNCQNNNPTASILANGSIILVYRANPCEGHGSESLGVAMAANWNSSYVRRPGGPVVSPSNNTGNHEDPFLFVDRRGSFHIITHDQSDNNVCGDSKNHACGAHLFSRDSWSWTVSPTPAYTDKVPVPAGGTKTLQTRQRPQLIFSDDGQMRPLFLFNGASFEGNNPNTSVLTHTMSFAFRSPSKMELSPLIV